MLPGGSASNVSVSAAHFGMESYQTGKIGDDNIGDEFIRTLKEDGVDAELVAVKKGGTTLHTYILTAPGGRHCIFANTGDTVCTLIPEELPEEIMDSMDIFYNDMFSAKGSALAGKEGCGTGEAGSLQHAVRSLVYGNVRHIQGRYRRNDAAVHGICKRQGRVL